MDDGDALADLAARGIAVARVAIGIGATVAPGLLSRVQFGSDSPSQRVLVRLLGGRDLALGLGVLLSARRASHGIRGWVEAGGLVDGVDALAFLGSRRGAANRRGLTALVAGSSAVVSAWAARQLSD